MNNEFKVFDRLESSFKSLYMSKSNLSPSIREAGLDAVKAMLVIASEEVLQKGREKFFLGEMVRPSLQIGFNQETPNLQNAYALLVKNSIETLLSVSTSLNTQIINHKALYGHELGHIYLHRKDHLNTFGKPIYDKLGIEEAVRSVGEGKLLKEFSWNKEFEADQFSAVLGNSNVLINFYEELINNDVKISPETHPPFQMRINALKEGAFNDILKDSLDKRRSMGKQYNTFVDYIVNRDRNRLVMDGIER